MKNDLSSSSSTGSGASRREFLVLGSAAVAAVAATNLSAGVVRTVFSNDETPRLSVGFADATMQDFAEPSFARAMAPASKLNSGDSSLTDGVRVKIHGIARPEALETEPVSIGLDAMYRLPGQEKEVPFLAWSFARLQHRTVSGGGTPFVVPVDSDQSLSLAVSSSARNAAVGSAMLRGTVHFDMGSGRRTNKLRTGVYFVALCPPGTREPDWVSLRAVAAENGGMPRLMYPSGAGLQQVSFEYIVFSTEHT